MGQRPKNELSTSGLPVRMPHPKVLGFRALYFAVAYGIFFIYNFKNVIFHFLAAARKIARLPGKKLFCPTRGGGWSPPPPAHTPMATAEREARDTWMGLAP